MERIFFFNPSSNEHHKGMKLEREESHEIRNK